MKTAKTPWSNISILIGVVIAILALASESRQTQLLLAAFGIWALWLMAALLFPAVRYTLHRKASWKRLNNHHTEKNDLSPLAPTIGDGPLEPLLLRHVNHRISAYLRSAYPDISWEWMEKEPERLILSGGTGRIRIFGVPDFSHVEVTFDQQANITCSMIKIVPLAKPAAADASSSQEQGTLPPNKQPVDPQIWFELQGRAVLESIVADLNSRGHSHLTLHEDGDICIDEGDGDVPKEHLSGFPKKTYWPRLVQVLERNGLTAKATDKEIKISW